MTLRVTLLRRARVDAESIYEWIQKRSPSGAVNWYEAFETAARKLEIEGEYSGLAPEAELVGIPLYQRFFRTRRGKRYRILFAVIEHEVRILRVRGPSQSPVRKTDLSDD